MMTDALVIVGLVLAIAVATWARARAAIRRDAGAGRGLAPGTGDHIMNVEYSSGLGGGHATQIRVPRDPQAYARRFVPRGARGAAGEKTERTPKRTRHDDDRRRPDPRHHHDE
jgi:hypothetical protein